jgi:DNA modification methylase
MTYPTQAQLVLPLLETLGELGGEASAKTTTQALAKRLDIPEEIQNQRVWKRFENWGPRWRYPWRQKVHWATQKAEALKLMTRNGKGVWTLSEEGRKAPLEATPGTVLVLYETPCGQILWAEAQSGAALMADNSIQLIFTSPPYPILKGRDYGTFTEGEIQNLIASCAENWKRILCESGSLVINFKDVWLPKSQTGGACRSLYQEKILLHLVEQTKLYFADRFFWKNPSHSPESPWVTIQKVRCNQDTEQLFWLSKSPNPWANTHTVMQPAKPSTLHTYRLRAARAAKTTTGPSGQKSNFEEQMEQVANGNALQVIPRNLLEISNADTRAHLRARLAEAGLPRHDAMMPDKLAEFFISLMTKTGQTVHDPFFGSGTTGVACQKLGRHFIGSESQLNLALGSALRFENTAFHNA